MPDLVPQIEALRRTASLARAARIAYARKTPIAPAPSQAGSEGEPSVDICPLPESISTDLTRLGLRPADATNIALAYERAALTYKNHVETKHRSARHALQQIDNGGFAWSTRSNSLFAAALVTTYLKVIGSWRSTILESVEQRIREIRDARLLQQARSKKSFNTVGFTYPVYLRQTYNP